MDFKDTYPDFAAIEEHIRKARVERSVAVAQMLAVTAVWISRGLRRMGASMSRNVAAERDRRAIEADSFLKRAVPRY